MTTKNKKDFVAWLGQMYIGFDNESPEYRDTTTKEIIKKLNSYDSEPKVQVDFEALKNHFHLICPSLPKIKTLSQKRKTSIRARIKEFSKQELVDVFKLAEASDFLSGRETKWQASIDWLINPTNFLKVLEGNYLNKGEQSVLKEQDGAPAGYSHFSIKYRGTKVVPMVWKDGIPTHKNLALDILLKKEFNDTKNESI